MTYSAKITNPITGIVTHTTKGLESLQQAYKWANRQGALGHDFERLLGNSSAVLTVVSTGKPARLDIFEEEDSGNVSNW